MKISEVIFVFMLNMSAFTFVIRILEKSMWSTRLVPIIVTMWLALHLLLGFLLPQIWLLSLFSFSSLFAIIIVSKRFVLFRQTKRHLPEILFHLNLFILQVRSGKSVRGVVVQALKVSNSELSVGVRCALEAVAFSQHGETKFKSPLLQKFHRVLTSAAQEGHHACSLLENLREEVTLLKRFRHKSGQATLQARMQSYVCVLLYVLLAAVLIKWMGWSRLKPFLPSSLGMMIVGVWLLNLLGRKSRWKV